MYFLLLVKMSISLEMQKKLLGGQAVRAAGRKAMVAMMMLVNSPISPHTSLKLPCELSILVMQYTEV